MIYSIPLSIQSPIDLERTVLEQQPTIIDEFATLEEMRRAINNLELAPNAEFQNNVFIALEIYSDSNKILLEYDKFHFKIGDTLYTESKELVQLVLLAISN